MARHVLACVFLVALTSAKDQSRWSRQISSYTSDLSDWVPLPGPGPVDPPPHPLPQIKRQAVAEPRILAEPVFPGFQRPTGFSQDFPGRTYFNSAANRQLYLQSVPAVPSAPQNFLSDQGFSQGIPQSVHPQGLQQGIRFGLAQPNFALNQGFVGPQFNFDSIPHTKTRPQLISNPVTFPKNQPSHQSKPFISQVPIKSEIPKFVDGYRADNITSFHSMKRPQSLQKLKYDTFDKVPKTEMVPPRAKSEKEEVQLLYVPLEQLNRGHFNFRSPISQSHLQNTDSFVQNPRSGTNSAPPKQTFAADFQRPVAKPLDNFSQEYFSNFNSQHIDQVPKFSTISTPFPTSPSTTPKPKKLKPHQPPLAIFLAQETKKGNQVKVSDVLSSLKNAESVAVLDSVNPLTAPKVFIGPSNLSPPDNFVKFELPYLSNIDHSDKKLRQLPFFVAPLSYNTPQGFAKIPFPSPHVGSVVINSQIKETTTLPTHIADVIPNSYSTSPQSYRQEQTPVTQKPSVSFYTTSAPKTNAPLTHQSNYYSFEPQTVSTVRTPPKEPHASIAQPKPESYFLSNDQYNHEQYNPAAIPAFNLRDSFNTQEPVKAFNVAKTEPTTQRTTYSSTTPKPSTYPNQLLETHNPYSINQAFHFSTPLDYHNLFDESYATPKFPQQQPSQPSPPPTPTSSTPSSTLSSSPKPTEQVSEKHFQTSQHYLQNNYSPEVQYESELTNTRYPISNTNDYTIKTEATPDYSQATQTSPQDNSNTYSVNSSPQIDYNTNVEAQAPIQTPEYGQNVQNVNNAYSEQEVPNKTPYYQYETSYEEPKKTNPTTSTTTTTRRTPARGRGRPRYTTPKADSVESTSRTVVTRRPVKERKPLPPRTRYEPNKISTERATRKPVDSSESTTKYSRGRTRGRIHYKPTEGDDYSGKSNTKQSTRKEADLAYQRDVLHQNYPVTLMERSSTVDIEAITEPVPKISSTKNVEPNTEVYDTENAYSYDRASVSQHIPDSHYNSREETYTPRSETESETYVPKLPSTREDYTYHSRSSLTPVEALSQYEESSERSEEFYERQTTPTFTYRTEKTEPSYSYPAESSSPVTEQSPSSYSISDLSSKPEEISTTAEIEITKTTTKETTPQPEEEEEKEEDNVVQTTPSYNRVRVRPGVVRQYHQSSTESSRTKTDRRRPVQAVTYRPAFDRRRTTMRIEEIEADLKTKQVHVRPEQEYRHPVYKPEPSTEPSVTSSSSHETTTKRGVFRRRRPSHTTTTTSTETSATVSPTTKRTYEVKNRFRGRRPTTEKSTTEKPEVQSETTTTTTRNAIYNRYSRPRLSDRFNKKPLPEETDDQDSNDSIIKPKYAEPETEQWSPKISTDSFKPYNPNDVAEDNKATTPASDGQDIITAKNNDYDDILLTVTPASNNRNTKKIPDIPPTLEALVEQSKVTQGDATDRMSTFESMLEEVMKSLDEQDEDEYTSQVMKHKGGEIGEIPPERIITSGDNYAKSTTVENQEVTTVEPAIDETSPDDVQKDMKSRRRGFWKKVKARPATTESIEAAESQYYTNTVNRLGHPVQPSKTMHDKQYNEKAKVTTYKPAYQFFNIFDDEDDADAEVIPTVDIPKIKVEKKSETVKEIETTEASLLKETPTEANANPGDMDLGTGSPDTTVESTYTTPTETTTKKLPKRSEFSFMDYLFGVTSEDNTHVDKYEEKSTEKVEDIQNITTEEVKLRQSTTESSFIPEEITAVPTDEDKMETAVSAVEIKKLNTSEVSKAEEKIVETSEKSISVETSSVSSFMDPNNVVSTSMSTEISHETEICFRGKCIKTSTDLL